MTLPPDLAGIAPFPVRAGRAAEAALWLLLAWLALRLLPFRHVARLLHPTVRRRAAGEDGDTQIAQPAQIAQVAQVARAVRAAARRVPWSAVCFPQGIAAQRMLCRRGIAADLHYGVAKAENGGLEAHVWVTAGGVTVVGGETAERFTPVTTFTPLAAPPLVAASTLLKREETPSDKFR